LWEEEKIWDYSCSWIIFLTSTRQKMHRRKTKGWQGKMLLENVSFSGADSFVHPLCYRNAAPGCSYS